MYRLWLLGLIVAAVLIIVKVGDWSLFELGIRTDNFRESFWPYTVFTLVGLATIALSAQELGRKPDANWRKDKHFLGLFIPISIAQVFLYRSFLIPVLNDILPVAWFVIGAHALLFMYLHIIYPNPKVNLLLALIGGAGFGAMYYYFPNFYLASLSHMALNFIAVYYGFLASKKGFTREENRS